MRTNDHHSCYYHNAKKCGITNEVRWLALMIKPWWINQTNAMAATEAMTYEWANICLQRLASNWANTIICSKLYPGQERQPQLDSLGGGVLGQDRQGAEIAGAVAAEIVGPVFDVLNELDKSYYQNDDVICFWNEWKVSTTRTTWVMYF